MPFGEDVVEAAEVPEAKVWGYIDVGAVAGLELAFEGVARQGQLTDNGGKGD